MATHEINFNFNISYSCTAKSINFGIPPSLRCWSQVGQRHLSTRSILLIVVEGFGGIPARKGYLTFDFAFLVIDNFLGFAFQLVAEIIEPGSCRYSSRVHHQQDRQGDATVPF